MHSQLPLSRNPCCSGVAKVVKNGPGASKFQAGQRVIAVPWPQFQGEGTWQQYVSVAEENLVGKNSSLGSRGLHVCITSTLQCRHINQFAPAQPL